MQKNTKHSKIIDELVDRLMKTGKYDFIFENHEYRNGNRKVVGEVDVLAFNMDNNTVRFYEIKCTHSNKAYDKAILQFYRFKKTFKHLDVKGIYVTPQTVKRLKI